MTRYGAIARRETTELRRPVSSAVSSRPPGTAITAWLILLLAASTPDTALSEQSPATPGSPPSQQPSDTLHAHATLVSATTGLVAGQTNWLALHFRIEEGWHLYWNGMNDTGYAPSLALELPEGSEAGPIRWPAPTRHVSPGGILDHVYEGDLALTFPFRPPSGTRPGDVVEIRGVADWLICRDLCIPERREVSIRLPIVAESEQRPDPRWSGRFEETGKMLPQQLPARAVRADWDRNTLRVRAPGANWIAFYPDLDSSPVIDLLGTGVGTGGRVELQFRPVDGEGPRASGVLEIHWPGDHRGFYRFRR